jgi:hypothetical protein
MEKISEINLPVFLKARDVVLLAKEARENGTIQCVVNPGRCRYWCEDTQTQCAVGQAFTPEAAKEFQDLTLKQNVGNIGSVAVFGLVTTDDLEALRALQRAHDIVGNGFEFDEGTQQYNQITTEVALARFDETIEKLLDRLPA